MNKIKREPIRKCVGCNISKSKKELYRIVKLDNNEIKFDGTGKISSRGIYICSVDCLNRIIKSKRIERDFDIKISGENYNQVVTDLNTYLNK